MPAKKLTTEAPTKDAARKRKRRALDDLCVGRDIRDAWTGKLLGVCASIQMAEGAEVKLLIETGYGQLWRWASDCEVERPPVGRAPAGRKPSWLALADHPLVREWDRLAESA